MKNVRFERKLKFKKMTIADLGKTNGGGKGATNNPKKYASQQVYCETYNMNCKPTLLICETLECLTAIDC
ncbi:MAG: hypothetical protein GY757_54525 [bacterium]|nr:hypothetical protein [bacterium]